MMNSPELEQLKQTYPKIVEAKGARFEFRLMGAGDKTAILNMAQSLSENDLQFMRRDITQPEMVDEWLHEVLTNRAIAILVEHEGRIVAYGTLFFNQFFWNRHLGELRIMVSSSYRNRNLGGRITGDLIAFAKTMPMIDKVFTYMAAEDKSAQRMTEDLGFKPEALLPDWVKTRDDRTHDLVIVAAQLSEIDV